MTKVCNICGGLLEHRWSSKIKMAVSSDANIINQYISVFTCKKCNHIQKIKDSNIDLIYKNYRKNDISDGLDYVKFIKNIPYSRTDLVLKHIKKYLKNKKNLMDVGTGTGAFLKSCDKYTDLQLSAFDLNTTYKNDILDINNVESFYHIDISSIEETFDAISLIHVLEHIEHPIKFLHLLKTKLNKDGILIIQVPDLENHLNDIVVYDHLSHFTKETVLFLLERVFKYVFLIDNEIHNELSIIASDSFIQKNINHQSETINNFQYIDKINFFLKSINKPIYVFGVAPVSTYFAGALNGKGLLKGFLDEDNSKINKYHLDKIVLHPRDMADIDICFIPLHKLIVEKIKLSYPNINFISIEDIRGPLNPSPDIS